MSVETAEFLDLGPSAPPILGNIPWGYGENRVTAMARDPHWLFVYWELTDDAIARARAEVNAPDADCILRVYDTTYKLFDGTNANWYRDVPVYRPANNHYVFVGHPASTLHVDIGVKSREGYFAKITRSAPVETPRDSISSDTRVEWMTVTHEESPLPEYTHRFSPRPGSPAPQEIWTPGASSREEERIMRSLTGEGWSRTEWSEWELGGRIVRWTRWSLFGPHGRVEVVCEGGRRIIRTEGGERLLLGPWRVTIYGLDPSGGERVIDRWAIHYSWVTESGAVRVETEPILRRILGGYRAVTIHSGSEARLIAESWASESLQIGASEWRWLGGSESWLMGASEIFYLGASELRYLGASETLFLGASEIPFIGASEFMGASELLGASEVLFLGASGFPGASEILLGGASEFPGASEARP